MKPLLAVLVISWIHYSHAKLLITGHPMPSLYGEPFKVECLLQDSNYTIDDVQIEEYTWDEFWIKTKVKRSYCLFMSSPKTVRTENTLSLTYKYLPYDKSFRCVLKGPNMTTPEYTEPLNFTTTNYLNGPDVFSRGSRCYKTLTVEAGDDVELECKARSSAEPKFFWYKEGDDWILPSSCLTLNNVSAMDEGRYTCIVEHPIAPVSKNVTITLSVLPAGAKSRSVMTPGDQKRWTKFDETPQLTIITASCAAFCLVVILSLTVYYCFYGRKIKTSKGPIDDHSAKKPIYKSSTESVPITCEDKRPLV